MMHLKHEMFKIICKSEINYSLSITNVTHGSPFQKSIRGTRAMQNNRKGQ